MSVLIWSDCACINTLMNTWMLAVWFYGYGEIYFIDPRLVTATYSIRGE